MATSAVALGATQSARAEEPPTDYSDYEYPGELIHSIDDIPNLPGERSIDDGEIRAIIDFYADVRIVYVQGHKGPSGGCGMGAPRAFSDMAGWEIYYDHANCVGMQLHARRIPLGYVEERTPEELNNLTVHSAGGYVTSFVENGLLTMFEIPMRVFPPNTGYISIYAPSTTSFWETLRIYEVYSYPWLPLKIVTHPVDYIVGVHWWNH